RLPLAGLQALLRAEGTARRARQRRGALPGGALLLDGPLPVTVRKSSYRSLRSLQRDNRVCRACAEAGYPLESLPVLEGYEGQQAYMLGQAPGVQEGEERRSWRGRAGRTLLTWLGMDEDEFYGTFYCASVTRCYPG